MRRRCGRKRRFASNKTFLARCASPRPARRSRVGVRRRPKPSPAPANSIPTCECPLSTAGLDCFAGRRISPNTRRLCEKPACRNDCNWLPRHAILSQRPTLTRLGAARLLGARDEFHLAALVQDLKALVIEGSGPTVRTSRDCPNRLIRVVDVSPASP